MDEFPKPDEKKFDLICTAICKVLWKDPSAAFYGRSGQKQRGLDSLGEFRAAQHKAYRRKKFTKKTITDDVAEADKSTTDIQQLLFLTTADADAAIQTFVRTLSKDRKKTEKFSVSVKFWDEICALLRQKKYSEIAAEHFPTHSQSTQRKTLKKVEEIESILKKSPLDSFFRDPRKYNLNIAKSIGYDSDKDVRPNRIVIDAQTKLLLVTGESGAGKSWTLCNFALAPSESTSKIFLRDSDPIVLVQAINDATKALNGSSKIVFVVDGLVEAAHVERVWQYVSTMPEAKLVAAVSDPIASNLKDRRAGGNSLGEYWVTRFTTANVLDYLKRHKIDHSQIPNDVLKVLKLPLLASVYAQVSGDKQFTGAMEYQLFDAFWNQAVSGKSERVEVLFQIASVGECADSATAAALMQCGWLMQVGGKFEFAHDRLRQWALAKHATAKVPDEAITGWIDSHTKANGYLLMDWLWMNLPAKAGVAFQLTKGKAKSESHQGLSMLLATIGGQGVPLLLKLLDECQQESMRAIRWCEAIAVALSHEPYSRRESLIGAPLRRWLMGSNEKCLLNAARILARICVPEAFQALWNQRIRDYEDLTLRSALYRAVKYQVGELPKLLLGCATQTKALIDDVCWHISDMPSCNARETWSAFQSTIDRGELVNSGTGVLRCVRKFRDLSFLHDVQALCDETLADNANEVMQCALVTWANLDPEAALPSLMNNIEASLGHRNSWVFEARRKAPNKLEREICKRLEVRLSVSCCSLIQQFGCEMSPSMFQAFVASLSKYLTELLPDQLPHFSKAKLFFACKTLDAWSTLRGSAAEKRLVDLLIARPFCAHTTDFCLSALAAINGEGIQRVLSDAEPLKQCWRVGDMLATSAKAPIPMIDAKNSLGYELGIVETEGLSSFIDRYLKEMPSNLSLDLFGLFEPMAASEDAYASTESILGNAVNAELNDLQKAWVVLALAPNPALNRSLESSMMIDREVGRRWVLLKALERANLVNAAVVDRALKFVQLGDLDAVNFLLGLNNQAIKQQLADLIVTEPITHQVEIAGILLNSFPQNDELRSLVQNQRLEVFDVGFGIGAAVNDVAKFGNEAQQQALLEHAIAHDDFFVSAQSEAIYALRHHDRERAIELAVSALSRSNQGNRKLCRLIAHLAPRESPELLLGCLARKWSYELGHSIGLMLRQLDATVVAQTIESFANSSSAKDRRAAVFPAAWVIGTEKIIENLLDDLDNDVADAAKSAFEAQSALDLAQNFADKIRAGASDRARLLEGYMQFVEPAISSLASDPLCIVWETAGFSKAQKIAIEERLNGKFRRKIDYEKLRSYFYWS